MLVLPALLAHAADGVASGIEARHARAVVAYLFPRIQCSDNAGFVDDAELDEHIGSVWLMADRDRSRRLTPDEYRSLHARLDAEAAATLFLDADANGDGVVFFAELRSQLGRLLDLLDENGDAVVSLMEAGASRHAVQRPSLN